MFEYNIRTKVLDLKGRGASNFIDAALVDQINKTGKNYLYWIVNCTQPNFNNTIAYLKIYDTSIVVTDVMGHEKFTITKS